MTNWNLGSKNEKKSYFHLVKMALKEVFEKVLKTLSPHLSHLNMYSGRKWKVQEKIYFDIKEGEISLVTWYIIIQTTDIDYRLIDCDTQPFWVTIENTGFPHPF